MPFSFLYANNLPITVQAKFSGKSRSSFYYKRKQPEKDAALLERIQATHHIQPYLGYRRIALMLHVNHKATYRLMKRHGIHAKTSRRIRSKNQYTKEKASRTNQLPGLVLTAPNQVWAGDFTHIKYKRRIFYLATVIDVYTRQVVGWHISSNHSVDLVIEALHMAIGSRARTPLIFHSDHGSEYLSEEYTSILHAYKIQPSYSAKGKPWQNGIVESFNYRFKEELGEPNRFPTFEQFFMHLCRQFKHYNAERIHSALKMTPDAFHAQCTNETESIKKEPQKRPRRVS